MRVLLGLAEFVEARTRRLIGRCERLEFCRLAAGLAPALRIDAFVNEAPRAVRAKIKKIFFDLLGENIRIYIVTIDRHRHDRHESEEQATPAHRHPVPHEPATTFIRRLQPVLQGPVT